MCVTCKDVASHYCYPLPVSPLTPEEVHPTEVLDVCQ